MELFLSRKCATCGGPDHPATGHQWSEDTILCMRCTKDFIRWIKSREAQFRRPWRNPDSGTSFVEAACTSVKPE